MFGFGFGFGLRPILLPDSSNTLRKEVGKDAGCQDNARRRTCLLVNLTRSSSNKSSGSSWCASFELWIDWWRTLRIDASQAARQSGSQPTRLLSSGVCHLAFWNSTMLSVIQIKSRPPCQARQIRRLHTFVSSFSLAKTEIKYICRYLQSPIRFAVTPTVARLRLPGTTHVLAICLR